jgi:alpha-tubulin suppressor-like RCC1 family protein
MCGFVASGGRWVCLGEDERGKCQEPADLGPVAAVAACGFHTCALQEDGRLVCFGADEHGQCSLPADLGPVVDVAVGYRHTCALQADGR